MRNPKDIIINGKTLETILEEHKHWINQDCEGWESMCADLSDIDLCHADLRRANLSGANLCHADLSCASLSDANLMHAVLCDALLYRADLIHAGLCGANLMFANLCHANLGNANLATADLSWANLSGADLSNANLSRTILSHTDLYDANLSNANLRKTKGDLIDFRRGKILTESIVGYKKCRYDIIVTLEIPCGAIVFSINGYKCRTNKAKVIAINDKKGNDVYRAYSRYQYMTYYVGDIFNITNFDLIYNEECGKGIHFFMSRKEAEEYEL